MSSSDDRVTGVGLLEALQRAAAKRDQREKDYETAVDVVRELVLQALADGISPSTIAQFAGLSRARVYQIKQGGR